MEWKKEKVTEIEIIILQSWRVENEYHRNLFFNYPKRRIVETTHDLQYYYRFYNQSSYHGITASNR